MPIDQLLKIFGEEREYGYWCVAALTISLLPDLKIKITVASLIHLVTVSVKKEQLVI